MCIFKLIFEQWHKNKQNDPRISQKCYEILCKRCEPWWGVRPPGPDCNLSTVAATILASPGTRYGPALCNPRLSIAASRLTRLAETETLVFTPAATSNNFEDFDQNIAENKIQWKFIPLVMLGFILDLTRFETSRLRHAAWLWLFRLKDIFTMAVYLSTVHVTLHTCTAYRVPPAPPIKTAVAFLYIL